MPTQNKAKPGRLWWGHFLKVLRKSGNAKIACAAARVTFKQVARAKALYPDFARRVAEAEAAAALAMESKVPGRGRGRPATAFPEHQRQTLLAVYGESGDGDGAAYLCGSSPTALRRLRARDPVFEQAWQGARTRAAGIAAICGPWPQRKRELFRALASGADIDSASRRAGMSPSLGAMLYARRGLNAREASNLARARFEVAASSNRFAHAAAPPRARPGRIRADDAIQGDASRAIAVDSGAIMAEAEKRLTPEMRAFLDLIQDDGLTLVQACERTGRTMREVALWSQANAFFALTIPD